MWDGGPRRGRWGIASRAASCYAVSMIRFVAAPVLIACCALVSGCGGDGAQVASGGADTASGGGGAGAQGGGGAAQGGAGGAEVLPIEAPQDAWAWRPIEGTLCGNGSTGGVAVNLHEGSTDLIIVVSGGGACWDDVMCNGDSPASIHLHEDLTEAVVTPELPPVDRSDPNNPLSSASWVYVPYCTGDLHWGDRSAPYASGTIEHRGASNMRTFLERLRATRPGSQRVFFLGGSAGGYGVTLHWGTAKEVFGDVEVHTLADASPLVVPLGGRWEAMKAESDPQLPAGCASCAADPGFLLDTLATAHPESRHGLMVYDDDAVIAAYFGFSGDLPAAIDALQVTHHDPFPNTKYFIAKGTDHGVLGDAVTAPDGTTPATFTVAWLLGDPAWHSVDF